MSSSNICKKISDFGSSIGDDINYIDQEILKESEKVKDATVKEIDNIINSSVAEIEKIVDKVENITEMIFDHVYNFFMKLFNKFFEIFMMVGCSSICCMMLPFILLGIILNLILKLLRETGNNDASNTDDSSGGLTMKNSDTYNLNYNYSAKNNTYT